jgi:hypothetical protein
LLILGIIWSKKSCILGRDRLGSFSQSKQKAWACWPTGISWLMAFNLACARTWFSV